MRTYESYAHADERSRIAGYLTARAERYQGGFRVT
jgi:hypothetical protein